MPLLELDGVTRRYGALVALDQVAMQVEEGEVRAVIGPNGAGKTTLFNVVTGTVKPSAGAIRFADQAIAGLASHQICRLGISRTFQITALFPEMSARENAMSPGRGSRCWAFAFFRPVNSRISSNSSLSVVWSPSATL